jgi:hypothetical protein
MSGLNDDRQSGDHFDFLDILFAAMVTIGLTPEVIQVTHLPGMLSENWVKNVLADKPLTLTNEEQKHFGTFIVGLLTLILSWFGVRVSLRKHPIRSDNVFGMFRFIFDVVLILLYGIILLVFKHIGSVLILLIIVYGIYFVWDVLKSFEYRERYWTENGRREYLESEQVKSSYWSDIWNIFCRMIVSLLFFISFICLYVCWPSGRFLSMLLLAGLLTILYRVAKIHPLGGIVATAIAWLACWALTSNFQI